MIWSEVAYIKFHDDTGGGGLGVRLEEPRDRLKL